MKLSDLEQFDPITIQCHDNPDADALASGFGLYTYFHEKGKQVRFLYAGHNQISKTNLLMMVERLEIPVTYLKDTAARIEGLLLTVDCQYGAGNVTRLEADQVAIIDHHEVETVGIALAEIQPGLGSCATLVWQMMKAEGFSFADRKKLGTALYYGLFFDTNQFSEMYNPLDMDMRDSLPCDKNLINQFKNSNLSLHELEIAGLALIKHIYNPDYRYAIIRANPCDPNILGLISDFLLQVDEVECCIVYNEQEEGYKFSVRSCVKEVRADELARFLADQMGSGGGHAEKAGGFLLKSRYYARFPEQSAGDYFIRRMNTYFESCRIIDAMTFEADVTDMKIYVKKKLPHGYVAASEILPVGTPIIIRTREGDVERTVEEDVMLMINPKGELYPYRKERFRKNYVATGEPCDWQQFVRQVEYVPTIRNRLTGALQEFMHFVKVCYPSDETYIYARQLEARVKVFTRWDRDKYSLGRPGDFLAVRCDDRQDIFIVEQDFFQKAYEEADTRVEKLL